VPLEGSVGCWVGSWERVLESLMNGSVGSVAEHDGSQVRRSAVERHGQAVPDSEGGWPRPHCMEFVQVHIFNIAL
jgi:hypothetical protein